MAETRKYPAGLHARALVTTRVRNRKKAPTAAELTALVACLHAAVQEARGAVNHAEYVLTRFRADPVFRKELVDGAMEHRRKRLETRLNGAGRA